MMKDHSEDQNSSNTLEKVDKSAQEDTKKSVLRIFGYEISASQTTKNPLLVLFGLVLVNVLLLILLRAALSI